jgi:hypothetical protein
MLMLMVVLLVLAVNQSRRPNPAGTLRLRVGDMQFVAFKTAIPQCSPEGPCPEALIAANYSRGDSYVLWLLYPKEVGNARMTAGRRLLTIPLWRFAPANLYIALPAAVLA